MVRGQQADALVVGAGPVGMFTALSLARRGLGVRIVDMDWRTVALSYALALHPRSLELLRELGVAEEVVAQGHRVDRVTFLGHGDRRGVLDLSALDGPYPFLLILPQSALENALEAALAEYGVTVEWSRELSGLQRRGGEAAADIDQLGKSSGGYAVSTTEWVVERRRSVTVPFVVGADGHRSRVRSILALDYERAGKPEYWAVFEFESDQAPDAEVRVLLEKGAAGVLWPLPDGRYRFGFQLDLDPAEAVERVKSRLPVQIGHGAYPRLDQEELRRLIAERAPWFTGAVRDLRWSLVVKFEKCLASRFGRDNILLAGDSAHLTGPVGIQSMNVGFREGHDLARRLADVRDCRASRDDLKEYGQRWRAEWRRLLGLTEEFQAEPGADPWIREHSAQLLSMIPASGEHLDALASQIHCGFGS